ncbi:MAG: single-stranded DNA-binding protein [Ruminococcaceae bacterium]|nr:single-stranded DNA-binding protein [Oscillospiraceae bacterium]
MNKVILVGRLTRDPELRTTASGVSVCSFSIAVNRRFKNAEGGYDADFINCVAWRQQAELLAKYFAKGRMVGIVGSIQTRNYDNKEGQKVYVTEVSVDEVHFVESKSQSGDSFQPSASSGAAPQVPSFDTSDGFMPMPAADDDLPF